MAKMYEDLAHTLFPEATDDEAGHPLMNDVTQSPTLLQVANQYNTAIMLNNNVTAKSILDSNEELANCLFNADKYNWMRDAIIAMERYYLNDVRTMIEDIASRTVGLDDTNSQESPSTNGYSITKITTMMNGTSTDVTLQSGTWQGSAAPFTYEISNEDITATNNVDVSLATSATLAQAKVWAKAMVMNATQAAGKITLKAYGKKPSINIPITVTVHA